MRIIKERKDVLRRLQAAGETCRPILCPNAETPDEIEGVLTGARQYARKRGKDTQVIGVGITAGYPDHPQLAGLSLGDEYAPRLVRDAASKWLTWLNVYAEQAGVFEGVEVIPFLDHGWVPLEGDRALMMESWIQEALGIIMFDASSYSFEENIRLTTAYVKSAGERVVVEACPDKVYEKSELEEKQLNERNLLSDPAKVDEFVKRTGVDLIVPNLGTEHRTVSNEPLQYRGEIAREIAEKTGPVQALHGTSSLGGKLGTVGADGICKINYYTSMARGASGAVRKLWNEEVPEGLLPISLACGSFIHRTRRAAIAENIQGVLEMIEPG